jgi:hypothetical protein
MARATTRDGPQRGRDLLAIERPTFEERMSEPGS